jgi:hypothetical protein
MTVCGGFYIRRFSDGVEDGIHVIRADEQAFQSVRAFLRLVQLVLAARTNTSMRGRGRFAHPLERQNARPPSTRPH